MALDAIRLRQCLRPISAPHGGTVDVPAPHRRAAPGPADRRRDPDRHRLVERFENADGPGETADAARPGRQASLLWTKQGVVIRLAGGPAQGDLPIRVLKW